MYDSLHNGYSSLGGFGQPSCDLYNINRKSILFLPGGKSVLENQAHCSLLQGKLFMLTCNPPAPEYALIEEPVTPQKTNRQITLKTCVHSQFLVIERVLLCQTMPPTLRGTAMLLDCLKYLD